MKHSIHLPLMLRTVRFLLRIAERRGYERGLAARTKLTTEAHPTVTLPDGSIVSSTSSDPIAEEIFRRLYPDAFRD